MPNSLVYPGGCAWSVELNSYKIKVENSEDVSIKVTNLTSEATYTCTEKSGTASVGNRILTFVQPSDYSGDCYTDSYEIEITGLKDVDTGEKAIIRYTVKFFDMMEYAPSYVVSVSPEKSNYYIYEELANTDDLKKIASVLPQEINVNTETGIQIRIRTNADWKLDEENQCFTNVVNAEDLPGNVVDKYNLVNDVRINYTLTSEIYDKYNSLIISPDEVCEGEKILFEVVRNRDISAEVSRVYQIKKKDNGEYYSIKRFDSTSSLEFEQSTITNAHYYNVDSVKLSDSGEYLSIYYSSSDDNDNVYVSSSIPQLTVTNEPLNINLRESTVDLSQKVFVYDGYAKSPEVVVKIGNQI